MSDNVFADKIKKFRDQKGWTLERLADEIGSTKSYIWELENKPLKRPSAEKVFKLSAALGIPADYLLDDNKIELVEDDRDRVFFSKYQKLDDGEKATLRRFLDSIDDD